MTLATKRYMAYIPAVVLAAGIAVISLVESPHMPKDIRLSDKTLHGLMYAVWAMTIAAGMFANQHRVGRTAVWTVLLTTAYGGLLEVLQAYCTVTRSGEWLDVVADALGGITGFVIVWGVYTWYKSK